MHIDFLLERFRQHSELEAIVWQDHVCTYGQLLDLYQRALASLSASLQPGMVVALEADFSPQASALFLALVELNCVIVPLTESVSAKKAEFCEIAEAEAVIRVDGADAFQVSLTGRRAKHLFIETLRERQHPGLVVFSSGSTGKSKAAIHDVVPLLQKFRVLRKRMRIIVFLLFDHLGGINTLLYTLSNTGCAIFVHKRTPQEVCRLIETYRAELLPTSPTFLNLLLLSEAYQAYDLSSLQLISYGSEMMPEDTLHRLHALLPKVRLQQTYGLSELGAMRTKSRSSDSLWVKVGGEDYATRVTDGLLEIKAKCVMLGYLNAPSPFTEDGWFKTGDAVLVDGEYLRFLGRQSELINVGGQKVYPAEVENVLQQMDGVEDVVVSGESSAITGQLVRARVKLATEESMPAFKQRMRAFCQGKLENFKIPQKVVLEDRVMYGDRFKKMRRG